MWKMDLKIVLRIYEDGNELRLPAAAQTCATAGRNSTNIRITNGANYGIEESLKIRVMKMNFA
jgi:hypothetical protein